MVRYPLRPIELLSYGASKSRKICLNNCINSLARLTIKIDTTFAKTKAVAFICNRDSGIFAKQTRTRAKGLVSTYLHESSARFVHRYSGALRVYPVTRGSDRRDYRSTARHRHHSGGAENEERAACPETGRSTSEEGHRTQLRGSLRRGRQKSGRCADQQRYVSKKTKKQKLSHANVQQDRW